MQNFTNQFKKKEQMHKNLFRRKTLFFLIPILLYNVNKKKNALNEESQQQQSKRKENCRDKNPIMPALDYQLGSKLVYNPFFAFLAFSSSARAQSYPLPTTLLLKPQQTASQTAI